MHKNTSGFTIVELVVVVSIIGILSIITAFSFDRYQYTARDSQRSTKVAILTEALEKYYDNNGEYPSCGAMTDTAAKVTTDVLPGVQLNTLVTPMSAIGVTNSFSCADLTGAAGEADVFAYVSNDASVGCSGSGVCMSYKLKYKDEASNTIKTVSSRRGVAVAGGLTWSKISNNGTSTCAIASIAKAYCWGYNGNGQLGNNSTTNSSVPVAVDTSGVLAGKTLTAINGTCVIASDAKAYCWGYNGNGQLGNNSTTNSSVPVAVDTSGVLAGKTLTAISSDGSSVCVLDSAGTAYCWGYNNSGQLGNGTTTASLVPTAVVTSGVLAGKTMTAISTGGSTCAIAYSVAPSDAKAYCWGNNFYGELGNNCYSGWSQACNSSVPVAVYTGDVLAGKTIVSILSSCALDSTGKAYCWGCGGGLGSSSDWWDSHATPYPVYTDGALKGRTLVSLTEGRCAIASSGEVFCWGGFPTVITGFLGKPISSFSGGGAAGCAITPDGKAYCWGSNTYGQLGNNSTADSTFPVAVAVTPAP